MVLKGYRIGYCLVVAESKEEAEEMYKIKTGRSSEASETNLDDIFCYFDLSEIEEEDHIHIYDRKYHSDGRLRAVSLKRPYARKYGEITGDKKEVIFISYPSHSKVVGTLPQP